MKFFFSALSFKYDFSTFHAIITTCFHEKMYEIIKKCTFLLKVDIFRLKTNFSAILRRFITVICSWKVKYGFPALISGKKSYNYTLYLDNISHFHTFFDQNRKCLAINSFLIQYSMKSFA